MSTRGTIRIYQDENDFREKGLPLVQVYNHSDSYPTGLGENLKFFCTGYAITRGINRQATEKSANGIGCFAAQLVKSFKDRIGGVYISHPKNGYENYLYEIYPASQPRDDNFVLVMKITNTYKNQILAHDWVDEITMYDD